MSPLARFLYDVGVIAAADEFDGWLERSAKAGLNVGPLVKESLRGG